MVEEESEILTAYALRFDGGAASFQNDTAQLGISSSLSRAIAGGEYPRELSDQLRCFFNLQRFLCKWGGEALPQCSASWRAYRTLFLMTALADVPVELRHPQKYAEWEERFKPKQHPHVSLIAGIHHRTRYTSGSTTDPNSGANLLDQYFVEDYLIGHVGHYFRAFGQLSKEDLFSIIIWKANRAKSKLAKMLLKRFPGELLEQIAQDLGKTVSSAVEDEEKLRVLIETFSFRLPMASAILSILYPDRFTVFDVRVCDKLELDREIRRSAESSTFEKVWEAYSKYREGVRKRYPELLSLRDKDRALWACDSRDQLKRDLARWDREYGPASAPSASTSG